jgi:hypothetical protein
MRDEAAQKKTPNPIEPGALPSSAPSRSYLSSVCKVPPPLSNLPPSPATWQRRRPAWIARLTGRPWHPSVGRSRPVLCDSYARCCLQIPSCHMRPVLLARPRPLPLLVLCTPSWCLPQLGSAHSSCFFFASPRFCAQLCFLFFLPQLGSTCSTSSCSSMIFFTCTSPDLLVICTNQYLF